MSSLRTNSKAGLDAGKVIATKRKHPSCSEGVVSSKENHPTPPVPVRTKRQKLCGRTPPAKPPRYINPKVAELKKQIECEYSIRDGGTKLLQASKNTTQSMQASKGLFVSDAKIIGYMRELQHHQNGVQEPAASSNELKPCSAKLAISDIRIPLEWSEFDQIKGKMDSHPCGVFCLFRIGNQVMDTPSLVEINRSTMDIIFPDVVIFPGLVSPDFALEIEVYCSVPTEDATAKPSTPIKVLKKLRHKEIREDSSTMARTAPSSPYTPRALNVTPSHRFALAGHAQLTIKDISMMCKTYALKRGMVGASGTASTGGTEDSMLLPLWGQICCKLEVEPECATEARITGFVNVHRMVGGLPEWKRFWCVMRVNHLRCWMYPEDVGMKMPVDTMHLTESMTVEPASRMSVRRPHTVLVKDKSSEIVIAFESKEDKMKWMDAMNQAILDLRVWQSSCGNTISTPQSKFYTKSPDEIIMSMPLPYSTTSAALSESETVL